LAARSIAFNQQYDEMIEIFLRIAAHERRSAERKEIGKHHAKGALDAARQCEERAARQKTYKFSDEHIS